MRTVNDEQDTSSLAADGPRMKNYLPVAALICSIAPVLLYFLRKYYSSQYFFYKMDYYLTIMNIIDFLIIPLGIAGLLAGIISLCLGKQRIGSVGKLISVCAIALPILYVLPILFIVAAFSTSGGM